MNFYTDVIVRHPEFRSTNDIRDLALLEPITRAAVQNIITDARALGIELIVTETYRSTQRQQQLYLRHLTGLKTVGVHHYGLAADFAKIVDGSASWDGDWMFLGKLCRKYNLVWGGDWGNDTVGSDPDWDHVQRVAVKHQQWLFDGSWYPEDAYDPYGKYGSEIA